MTTPEPILAGVKVLDVGTFIFGPAAATVLADYGADVIKVETPGLGDPYRYLYKMPPMPVSDSNYGWILTARNKRSIALDLRVAAAREVLHRLVLDADVFVTNYQPSVAAKLGVAYAELAALNPRLVYAHATGYGELGSEAEKPGYDATAWWARSGLMDLVRDGSADPALSMPGMGDHAGAMALFLTDVALSDGGTVKTVDSPISLAGCAKVPARAAPSIGEHTDDVLRSLGYDNAEIEKLRQGNAVA
jgi:formyl-CoA transferase